MNTNYTEYFIEDLEMFFPTENSKKKYRYWLMRCKKCGTSYKVAMQQAKNKGYLFLCNKCSLERRSSMLRTVGSTNKNKKLYQAWADMKGRCYNKNSSEYIRYGARGITVCDEWKNSSKAFIEWALTFGDTSQLSLDRIDPNGNYEPSNCRWETKSVQAQNTRLLCSTNTTGYKGVSLAENKESYVAKISVNNIHKNIGTYKTALEASYAYDWFIRDNDLEHTQNHPNKYILRPKKNINNGGKEKRINKAEQKVRDHLGNYFISYTPGNKKSKTAAKVTYKCMGCSKPYTCTATYALKKTYHVCFECAYDRALIKRLKNETQ